MVEEEVVPAVGGDLQIHFCTRVGLEVDEGKCEVIRCFDREVHERANFLVQSGVIPSV